VARRLILLAAVVALLLLAAYAAASVFVYDTLTKVPGDCPAEFASNEPGSFSVPSEFTMDPRPWFMPAPEDVRILSRDAGIELAGWWLPSAQADAPAVIVVHGVAACRRDHTVLLPAGMLHRNGFSVLLVDYRDHGDATIEDGRFAAGTEEYRDVLGAWDWLQAEHGIAAGRIGLLGLSLGAATVLIATGEEPRIAATWEDSSYADLPSSIRDELRRSGYPEILDVGGVLAARILSGDDLTSRSPIDEVRKLEGRALFITHGDADERINVRYAGELAAAVRETGGTVEPWIVAGAGHTAAAFLHPEEYESRLVGFFRSALGGIVQ
jgi:dipeptidyl aminopeptidase/acylaminoacyl peptidase